MDGIVVAADQTLEWLLPWWWEHYQQHNRYPVAFIDIGLCFEKKRWCEKRGERIALQIVDFTQEVDPEIAAQWNEEYGSLFWESRSAWFKKPLCCLKSPFERNLWIDLDCEIRGSLAPLFSYANGFALAKEQSDVSKGYPLYNSGVIAFRKNHPLLELWSKQCLDKNHLFRGDQEVLSHLLADQKIQIEELPPRCNWSRCLPEQRDTLIQHWHGEYGKRFIRYLNQSKN